jgi:DNA-binding transcriptional regulator YbjK
MAAPEAYFQALAEVRAGKKSVGAILNTTKLSPVALQSLEAQRAAVKKAAADQKDGVLAPLAKLMAEAPARQPQLLEAMLESGSTPGTDTAIHPLVLEVLREKKPATEEAVVRACGGILAAATAEPDDAAKRQVREAFTACSIFPSPTWRRPPPRASTPGRNTKRRMPTSPSSKTRTAGRQCGPWCSRTWTSR